MVAAENLKKLTAAELEAEANKLLYGSTKVAKHLNGHQYQLPRYVRKDAVCEKCKSPISVFAARVCRACYRRKKEKLDPGAFAAVSAGLGFENQLPIPIAKEPAMVLDEGPLTRRERAALIRPILQKMYKEGVLTYDQMAARLSVPRHIVKGIIAYDKQQGLLPEQKYSPKNGKPLEPPERYGPLTPDHCAKISASLRKSWAKRHLLDVRHYPYKHKKAGACPICDRAGRAK